MRLERRQVILGAVAIVVLGIAVWTLWPSSTPAPVTAPRTQARARTGRPNAAAATEGGPVDPVKLHALTASASRGEPGDAQRNPFRFQPKVVAPIRVPTPPIAAPPPPVVDRPIAPAERPLPPIPLKFVGLVERASGVKWAVLTDGKSTPMYGKDGDIIDGRYLIVKIGAESIEMTYTNGQGRQVIRLTGQ